jgi:uncharacterized protein
MGKLLLMLVLVVVIGLWVVNRLKAFARRRDEADETPPRAARPARRLEAMVSCAHCGVHLPERDAVLRQGAPFCSDAHALAGPRAGSSDPPA